MEKRHSGLHFDPTARIAIANVTIDERRSKRTAPTMGIKQQSIIETTSTNPSRDRIARLQEAIETLKSNRRRGGIGRWEFEGQRLSLQRQIRSSMEGGE